MRNLPKILLGIALLSAVVSTAKDNSSEAPLFTENKGQLTDQHLKPRADIHYYGSSDGLSYFFKSTGISYQLYEKGKRQNEVQISRIDMSWLGANSNATVITKNTGKATDNFFNTSQSAGITNVRSFGDIQYENIYAGINLHYYYKNSSLKYDFIVAPGADYKKIKIKVEGATSLMQNKDGSISIITANGTITEAMPVAFQDNKAIETNWVLDGDVLSFELANYNPALPLVIDPLVYQWNKVDSDQIESASYAVFTSFNRNITDAYGNVYVTRNKIMPSGLNQYIIRLYKYNSSSTQLWAKYLSVPTFNDSSSVEGISIYDTTLYFSGTINNTGTIATTGAYQTTINGQKDGFLMKCDSNGTKIWGTYFGGTGNDIIKSCKVDSAGYVYVCGATQSTTNIAGTGAQQNALAGLTDGFVAKFSAANGFRTWGTYFGGADVDSAKSIDVYGNRIYVAGITKSTTGIATTGAQQAAFSGNVNGFLLCMDTSGVTQWSTYYGIDSTLAERCIANSNSVYLSGSTNASTGIATAGTYQPANAGGFDGFLAKFNLSGVRQWGTYYGGTAQDFARGCALGNNGNVYLCGNTKSTTGITTPNSYNDTYVTGQYYIYGQHIGLAYLAELDANGQRVSGTYYNAGGSADWCSVNNTGDVYISGYSAYVYDDYKSYVAKFSYCNAPTPIVTASSTAICPNGSVQLSTAAVTGATYKWYKDDVALTGATTNTYSATLPGVYKVILNACPNGVSATVTLTAVTAPTTAVVKTDIPCSNATIGSITVTPSGGTSPYAYTWDNSSSTSATRTGLASGSYIVHTSDANNCMKTDTVTIANTNNVPVSTTEHTDVPCYGDPLATITVSTTGGTTPYAYSWDNLPNTTAYLDGLATGTYIVHTTDANNCADADTVLIEQSSTTTPSDPLASICAVTVDSATGKNIILWQKSGVVNAVSYNIYRETEVAGQYTLLGNKLVGESSVMVDNTALPLQQSYSYRIAEVDSCDHEWPMSDLHKTIHLAVSIGVNGENNLSWNAYEGKPYTTHSIYRSFNDGPYTLLNEVSNTITSYSDLTPPIGSNTYRIQINLGPACDTAVDGDQYVISNKIGTATTGIDNITANDPTQILPNPTTGSIRITGSSPDAVRLYDVTGKLMLEKNKTNTLNISAFAKGIYLIRLYNRAGTLYHSEKIVLQ